MRRAFKHLTQDKFRLYSFYLDEGQIYMPLAECLRFVFGTFLSLMIVLVLAKCLGDLGGLDEWLIAFLGASLY